MSIRIRRFAELSAVQIRSLEQQMASFYRSPPPEYYTVADRALDRYTRNLQPFHCDLLERISSGTSVLELGCGTAHLCRGVEDRGASYTGMDYGASLLAENARRYPHARFLPIDRDVDNLFDTVASLYTLEHVTQPPAYLERMWSLCKPGGQIAIICPEFIDTDVNPPSLIYGITARRLREKLRKLAFRDAALHIFDVLWTAPRWRKRAKAASPGAFWINLQPRALSENYVVDADAIHLTRLSDITDWLMQRGGTILVTSKTLTDIPAEVLRFNCYVVARKPITDDAG